MDLFGDSQHIHNLLPQDGTVHYHPSLLNNRQAEYFLEKLRRSLHWKHDECILFGKHITTKRKVAWYADKPFHYRYSNMTKTALAWTPELIQLKTLVERETNETYNACLLNLYHNGDEGMSWHSDNEKELKKNGTIASLSLGAERKFCFKHKKTHTVISLFLQNGSLLVMKDQTQRHWLHRLPTTKKITDPRINLTFRTLTDSTDNLLDNY